MAYDGELVKMENGRWARFQRCRIDNRGHQDGDADGDLSILVAVELDEHYQDLLNAAESSLESYRKRGIPVQVQTDEQGKIRLSFAESPAMH